MRLCEILQEARLAPLFHGTTLPALLLILRSNSLETGIDWRGEGDRVALTRDYRKAMDFSTHPWDGDNWGYCVVLVLDQDALSRRYRIRPHADTDSEGAYWPDEMEEAVFARIAPLDRYLISINIDPDQLRKAKEDDYFVKHVVRLMEVYTNTDQVIADITAIENHHKLNQWRPRTGPMWSPSC